MFAFVNVVYRYSHVCVKVCALQCAVTCALSLQVRTGNDKGEGGTAIYDQNV